MDLSRVKIVKEDKLPVSSGCLILLDCNGETEIILNELLLDGRIAENYFFQTCDYQSHRVGVDFVKYRLAARLQKDGPIIGFIEIMGNRMGYFVDPSHWGYGYGEEMIRLFCDRVGPFCGIPHLYATALRDNIASSKILSRAGFSFDGLTYERSTGKAGRAVLKWRYDF